MADALLSQAPIEIAIGAGTKLAQQPLEILVRTEAALSQLPLEILIGQGALLSQAPLEVLTVAAPPGSLVAQLPIEIAAVSTTPIPVALSQLPLELLVSGYARISQLALEILVEPGTHISQLPIEILLRQFRQGWRLTIDGEDVTGLVDAVTITAFVNERARATIVVADRLPPKFAEVVSYAKDGITKIFGGVIVTRHLAGRNQYDPTFTVSLECGDYFTYADWVHVTRTYDQPVTLKAVLQDLVANYLSAYGITLDPAQVDGPVLAPFVWSDQRVSDALRELSDRTEYVARITATKLLRMFIPGTDPAPFTITDAAPHSQELSWADTEAVAANLVKITAGPTGQLDVIGEQHFGDGITQIFPLYAPMVEISGALHEVGSGIDYPVGIYGVDDLPYTYDQATNAIRHHAGIPPLAAGDSFLISYGATFPFQVTATNGARPVIEYSEARPDVLSIPAAQEIADQLLAKLSAAPVEVSIVTDEDGWVPGQALTIDLPLRQLVGAFTITEVGLVIVQDTGPDDEYWQYTLKAIASTRYQGSYLDEWRRLTVAPSTYFTPPAATTRRRPG